MTFHNDATRTQSAPAWWAALFAAVFAAAAFLHSRTRSHDLECCQRAALLSVAEVLAAQFRADGSMSAVELQAGCDRLIQHPAVAAVTLWDQAGAALATAGLAPSLIELTKPDETGEIVCREIDPPPGLARNLARLVRVDARLGTHFQPSRPARLCLLMAPDKLLMQPGGHVAAYYAPLFVVIGGTLFLALRVWRWRVWEPLQQTLALLESRADRHLQNAPPERNDEWGRLMRSIIELRGEAGNWRTNARLAELRVDQHHAEETQRIAKHLKQAERASSLDPLTGLGNRRLLNERLPTLFTAQRAAQRDVAAVMLDLDHFKKLNDTMGHAAGDEILSFAGELLAAVVPVQGLAVRYGGDEFLLILPGANAPDAVAIAQRIIAMFTQRVKMMGPQFAGVSMTAGIATLWQHDPGTPRELIVMADRALYQGKRAGKKGARVYGVGMTHV